MASPSESRIPARRHEIDAAAFRKQGIVAGLFGALLLAAWFLYLDTIRGKPFFTPTLLGSALLGFGHVESPETLTGHLGPTLVFTIVHAAVFAAIGFGVAQILLSFARVRSRALILLLIFALLCVAFLVFGWEVSAVGPGAIALRDAILGNAFAAFGMTAYLARNLPREMADEG